MKRNRFRRFFQQKQYAIASLILFAAIAAMTGVYFSNRITSERQEEEMAQKEAELSESLNNENKDLASLDSDNIKNTDKDNTDNIDKETKDTENKDSNNTQDNPQEDVASVTAVIKPQETKDRTQKEQTKANQENTETKNQKTDVQSEQKNQNDTSGEQNAEQKEDPATQGKAASVEALHFSPESDLGWPLQGDVILNYSMDQTVYFATLEQYKYNPALIIAGKVNDPVQAAATGKITDISTNEETGVTVTMDLGDGYTAVYGQLKEVLYNEGAIVETGNTIGYIAEPTKYYSVEGSNLFFELKKDDQPVNPMQFIE